MVDDVEFVNGLDDVFGVSDELLGTEHQTLGNATGELHWAG